MTRPVADGETYALLESTHKREWYRLESDAWARERNAQDTGRQTLVASRPWTDRTRWAITYDGVRDILLDFAAMPYAGTTDHAVGTSWVAARPRIARVGMTKVKARPQLHHRIGDVGFLDILSSTACPAPVRARFVQGPLQTEFSFRVTFFAAEPQTTPASLHCR